LFKLQINGFALMTPAEFLEQEFPSGLHPLVPGALRRAYASADAAIDQIQFLQTKAGFLQRGDLIVLATEYEFWRLIENGSLDFDYSWEPYARPTGLHLVMRTPNARVTISQVQDPDRQPRSADFRSNYAVSNERSLFEEDNRAADAENALKHILLLHGYQALTFAHLALPSARGPRHIYRTPNLFGRPYEETGPVVRGPNDEGPRESPDPGAVEHIKRTIADNDL
jgi:hypothetical protein